MTQLNKADIKNIVEAVLALENTRSFFDVHSINNDVNSTNTKVGFLANPEILLRDFILKIIKYKNPCLIDFINIKKELLNKTPCVKTHDLLDSVFLYINNDPECITNSEPKTDQIFSVYKMFLNAEISLNNDCFSDKEKVAIFQSVYLQAKAFNLNDIIFYFTQKRTFSVVKVN